MSANMGPLAGIRVLDLGTSKSCYGILAYVKNKVNRKFCHSLFGYLCFRATQ